MSPWRGEEAERETDAMRSLRSGGKLSERKEIEVVVKS